MNYRKIYIQIINNAKNCVKEHIRPRSRYYKKDFEDYYEFHHILPRSLFPQYSKNKHNLACLTAKEHFICHRLLCKIYPCYQMYYALSKFMSNSSGKRLLSSSQYNICRKITSLANKELNKINPEKRLRVLNICNTVRLNKIKELKELGKYVEYKNDIVIKRLNTQRENYEKLSEQEKIELHNRRSKLSSVSAKKTSSQRLEKMKDKWPEINVKIAMTKSKWSIEKRKEVSKKMSEHNYFKHLDHSSVEYKDFCEKMSVVAVNRNLGRKWWTNGSKNKFQKYCPGSKWYLGRTKRKK